jgi:CheY-like chemotaxis protein
MSNCESQHRVMIVDDDEITSGLLAHSLGEAFVTRLVDSGKACIDEIGSFVPEVVLLDIEMPGMDGYETCRRLREMLTDSERPAVIFISGHDTLDERLLAYDSGGDDFISKPPMPDEVARKIKAMVALVAARRQSLAEKASMQEMAMGFLTNLGESGTALQFLRNSPTCTMPAQLAKLTQATLCEYGLEADMQMRMPAGCLTFSGTGPASPLVESMFAQVRDLGRIFQFRQRLIINYPHISVLVNNLPIEDEGRCGRLRDHLAIVAEGCEACVLALIRTAEIEQRRAQLEKTAKAVSSTIDTLRSQYREQQSETRVILHQLNEHFAKELMRMALTERQEDELQAMLSNAINSALNLFQRGLDFDAQLGQLLSEIKES